MALRRELVELGELHGLDRIGFCDATAFEDVHTTLIERKDVGLSADMAFTYRNPRRSTDPSQTVANARSLVVGARSYRRQPGEASSAGAAEKASIAEYVWEPHYAVLRDALEAIAQALRAQGFTARVVVDDNALVDRAAAYRAGIGWWGKNSNILVPGLGSKVVLGSVITDADLDPTLEAVADQCGPCRRCIDACPTDAIVADGVIDSNRCLAWLVQSPGAFPREFRQALGDRIYGCDDCQTSCPPNVLVERGEPAPTTTGQASVEVEELLTLDDETLMARFGAWYIPRREPRYLRRNALLVLGNVGDASDPEVRALVERYADSDDEVERSHALWAAHQLGYDDLIAGRAGDAEMVVEELAALR